MKIYLCKLKSQYSKSMRRSVSMHLFFLNRPLLKLLDKLFMVGIINDEDLDRLLVMVDPQTWDPDKEKCKEHD